MHTGRPITSLALASLLSQTSSFLQSKYIKVSNPLDFFDQIRLQLDLILVLDSSNSNDLQHNIESVMSKYQYSLADQDLYSIIDIDNLSKKLPQDRLNIYWSNIRMNNIQDNTLYNPPTYSRSNSSYINNGSESRSNANLKHSNSNLNDINLSNFKSVTDSINYADHLYSKIDNTEPGLVNQIIKSLNNNTKIYLLVIVILVFFIVIIGYKNKILKERLKTVDKNYLVNHHNSN